MCIATIAGGELSAHQLYTFMFFHHIFFFSSLAFRLNTPAWFWSSSNEDIYRDFIRIGSVYDSTRNSISPAARSIVSNFTQFWSARSTFSCITSFTVSTFFVTDASLSTSSRLSYFWQIFWSRLPHVLSRALSFAMVAFSPALAENCFNNVRSVRCSMANFGLGDASILTVRWSSSRQVCAHRWGYDIWQMRI